MAQAHPRNVLKPWIIGIVMIAVIEAIVVYWMFAASCPAPGAVEAIVLIVIPVIYLGLMYLALKSQD